LELGPVSSLTRTLFVFRRLIGTIIFGSPYSAPEPLSWAALRFRLFRSRLSGLGHSGGWPLDVVGSGGTAVGFAAAGWALDLPPQPGRLTAAFSSRAY
jgi:hypothetical protein